MGMGVMVKIVLLQEDLCLKGVFSKDYLISWLDLELML